MNMNIIYSLQEKLRIAIAFSKFLLLFIADIVLVIVAIKFVVWIYTL